MAKDLLMAEILHQLIATSSFIPLFTRFYTSQAVVWDVWTSNKRIQHKLLLAPFRPHCHFANATFSRQVFMDPHHKTITGRIRGTTQHPMVLQRLWTSFMDSILLQHDFTFYPSVLPMFQGRHTMSSQRSKKRSRLHIINDTCTKGYSV